MKETRAMLATVTVTSLLVGLVLVSPVMISVGVVASVALLLHEVRS